MGNAKIKWKISFFENRGEISEFCGNLLWKLEIYGK